MKIKPYIVMSRPFVMGFSAVSPILGYIGFGGRDPLIMVALFVAGCFAHAAGYIHNDIVDRVVDTNANPSRPLVTGEATEGGSFVAVNFCSVMVLLIAVQLYSYLAAIFFMVSLLLTFLYNASCKVRPFGELLLAGGVAAACLGGGALAGWSDPQGYLVTGLGVTQVWFMAAVLGNIKDWRSDFDNKVLNTMVWLHKGDELEFPSVGFLIYGFVIMLIWTIQLGYLLNSMFSACLVLGTLIVILGHIFDVSINSRPLKETLVHYLLMFLPTPIAMGFIMTSWAFVWAFIPLIMMVGFGIIFKPKGM